MKNRIVFHNGKFVPESDAHLAVQDRGVLFADGVYEVVRFDGGQAFAMDAHIQRLARSMAGIELEGVPAESFAGLSVELLERNGLTDAKVYWQVTRGRAARDFVVPEIPEPSVTLIAYPMSPLDRDAPLQTGSAIVVDDCRWTSCWIKSLMLLPASLAKTRASRAGAVEAIFERAKPGTGDKHVTEGASTNVFIVADGVLRTHPDDGWVLGGITRQTLLGLADRFGIPARDDEPFTAAELRAAQEVLICSTTQLVAITAVDDAPIADGRPGPVTQQLAAAYHDAILS